jgi:hypothetical protein
MSLASRGATHELRYGRVSACHALWVRRVRDRSRDFHCGVSDLPVPLRERVGSGCVSSAQGNATTLHGRARKCAL